MHIELTIKDKPYEYYQFFPQSWHQHRYYVGITLCSVNANEEVFKHFLDDNDIFEQYGYKQYGFGRIQVVFFKGSVKYQLEKRFERTIIYTSIDSQGSLPISNEAPEGIYMLIANKLNDENENTYEQVNVSYLAGLAMMQLGYYLVKDILISQPIELTYSDNRFYNTLSLSMNYTVLSLNLNIKALTDLAKYYHSLAILEQDINNSIIVNRVKLSLNWYVNSTEMDDVNKFLSLWIGIEVLILNGITDLKILKKAIANAYDITVAKVDDNFLIGRLFGLRSRVVHKGQIDSITPNITEYLSCLYKDLFDGVLNLPCQRHSESYLSNEGMRERILRLVSSPD